MHAKFQVVRFYSFRVMKDTHAHAHAHALPFISRDIQFINTSVLAAREIEREIVISHTLRGGYVESL